MFDLRYEIQFCYLDTIAVVVCVMMSALVDMSGLIAVRALTFVVVGAVVPFPFPFPFHRSQYQNQTQTFLHLNQCQVI